MIEVFSYVAGVSLARLDPPTLLLANGLSAEVRKRRLENIAASFDSASDVHIGRLFAKESGQALGAAALSIGESAMATSTIIYRETLCMQAQRIAEDLEGPSDMMASDYGPMPTSAFFSEDDLRALDIRPVSMKYAAMRADELLSLETRRKLIGLDESDQPVFHSHLKTAEPPELLAKSAVLHRRRLSCPALQVSGQIDMGLSLVPDIIITANRQLAIA